MDVNNIKTTIGTFNKLNIVIFIGNNQKLLTLFLICSVKSMLLKKDVLNIQTSIFTL